MKPPASKKRSAPEKLDIHPADSKHSMMSDRVRKHALKDKEKMKKRKQRAKNNGDNTVENQAISDLSNDKETGDGANPAVAPDKLIGEANTIQK